MTLAWDSNNNLYEEYLNLFKKLSINNIDVDTLNRYDQIHAGGITATKKIANLINFKKNQKVLELGGGIGGVARFLAKNFNLYVYNLDLSFSYSLTGYKLNSLIKEKINVFYVNADAIYIPFKSKSFDIVWSQHINMNIKNKNIFFEEIKRILKNDGILVFHEWFLNDPKENVLYPLPWSDNSNYSFLITLNHFLNLAREIGFKVDFCNNDTSDALYFYKKIYETKAYVNPIFKGRDGEQIFRNIINLIEKSAISVYYGLLVL